MKVLQDTQELHQVVFIDPAPRGNTEAKATVMGAAAIRFNAAAVRNHPFLTRYTWARVGRDAVNQKKLYIIFDTSPYTHYVMVRKDQGTGRIISAYPVLRTFEQNPAGMTFSIAAGHHEDGPMLILTME